MPNDFKKILSARFFFYFATEMQAVIVGWRMYALTGDPLALGLVGLAEAVPAIGIALYAGYVVDRSRPLFVYRNVVLGSLGASLIIVFSQWESLALAPSLQVKALYLSSFLGGISRGFAQPSMYAIVPRLLSRSQLSQGAKWSASSLQMSRISGPGVGGLIFGWFGMEFSAVVVCVMFLLALTWSLSLRSSLPAPNVGVPKSIRTELLSGLSFVLGHRILLPALTLDMLSVFFGGVTALLPIYASDILKVGPRGLGLLRAAPSVAAVVTSIVLLRMDIRGRAGTWLLWSVVGFSLSILVFGISTNLAVSLVALGLSGAFDSVSMVVRGAAVQLASPEAMRGRISSVNSIFVASSNELGEFESGVMAKFFGTVPAVMFGGAMSLIVVGLVALTSPALRALNLKDLETAPK